MIILGCIFVFISIDFICNYKINKMISKNDNIMQHRQKLQDDNSPSRGPNIKTNANEQSQPNTTFMHEDQSNSINNTQNMQHVRQHSNGSNGNVDTSSTEAPQSPTPQMLLPQITAPPIPMQRTQEIIDSADNINSRSFLMIFYFAPLILNAVIKIRQEFFV